VLIFLRFRHSLFSLGNAPSSMLFFSCIGCQMLNNLRGPTDIGMSRLTLSDADKQARDWFVETTKSLGCDVKVDAMGELLSDSRSSGRS
jgi:hypothetical protein